MSPGASPTDSGLTPAPENSLPCTPEVREIVSSELPAVAQLIGLGYTYLTPPNALRLRRGRRNQVILADVLLASLARLNQVVPKCAGRYARRTVTMGPQLFRTARGVRLES